ncbi:hypothetical protein [Agaribacterium sp. ZY112]|uniref:hypothetical protein n=1 Tax=Agaribacterium sp. ZY112 TaxID=3233574 RepID=UPI00352342A9
MDANKPIVTLIKMTTRVPSFFLSLFLFKAFFSFAALASQAQSNNADIPKELVVAARGMPEIWAEQVGKQSCDRYKLPEQHDLTRGFYESLIACRALKAAGIDTRFKFIAPPSHARAIRMVEEGKVDLLSESAWLSDSNPELVYISDAVVREGRFVKGLYALKGHPILASETPEQDYKNYRAITVEFWHHDKQALKSITDNIVYTAQHNRAHEMLLAGRADYTLYKFAEQENLETNVEGVPVLPVQGIKVALPGSRHFLVNAQKPYADNLTKALNKGLMILREEQDIEDFLGVSPTAVEDWILLNP